MRNSKWSVVRGVAGGLAVIGLASGAISMAVPAGAASAATSAHREDPESPAADLADLHHLDQEIDKLQTEINQFEEPLTKLEGSGGSEPDEVSASVAALFGAYSLAYQQLSAEAATFHRMYFDLLSTAGEQTP